MQDPLPRSIGRLSLRALRYFVAAAETGSVTGGAHQVRVSQPSISAALALDRKRMPEEKIPQFPPPLRPVLAHALASACVLRGRADGRWEKRMDKPH